MVRPSSFFRPVLIIGNLIALIRLNRADIVLDPGSEKKGAIVCSGDGDIFVETVTMLEQMRYRLQSALPVVVAHCGELASDRISVLQNFTNVSILDICGPQYSEFKANSKRMSGFFCKPAALLLSPFQHTMIVDSDVIWFQKPELLFDAELYKSTGSLFFRDRWTQTNNKLTLTAASHSGSHAMDFVRRASERLKNHLKSYPIPASFSTAQQKPPGGRRQLLNSQISATQQLQSQNQNQNQNQNGNPLAFNRASGAPPGGGYGAGDPRNLRHAPGAGSMPGAVPGPGMHHNGKPPFDLMKQHPHPRGFGHKPPHPHPHPHHGQPPGAHPPFGDPHQYLRPPGPGQGPGVGPVMGPGVPGVGAGVGPGVGPGPGHLGFPSRNTNNMPHPGSGGGANVGPSQNKAPQDGDPFSAQSLAATNAFWRHLATGKEFTPDHWQDSSVVMLDKRSHPKTLKLLQLILMDFDVGYGDKEMYWLAATAAREPFAFEPHIVGSFGDCGALLHFDPRVNSSSSSSSSSSLSSSLSLSPGAPGSVNSTTATTHATAPAEPFYLNAEYLIDTKKFKKVGDFTSAPHNGVTSAMKMDEATTKLFILQPWKKMDHGFYPCGACRFANCTQATDNNPIVKEIRLRQKMVLALNSGAQGSPPGGKQRLTLDLYRKLRTQYEQELVM